MSLLNLLTLISYIALNIDVILQLKRIYKTKSSKDLSLFGMAIRFAAIIIVLIKFISIKDTTLVVGQGLIAVTFTIYFILALSYFKYHKKKR